MIGILDQLDIQSADLPRLQALMEADYLPGATRRGMTLRSTWVSPPVALPDAMNTLWALWEVPDVGAWWNMRFQSGADPSVIGYWTAVDKLCAARQRHYLVDGQPPNFAQPHDLGTERITKVDGVRQTAQYFLRTDAKPEHLAAWQEALLNLPQHIPGLRKVFLGRNLEGSFHAGDFTFDAHFIDSNALNAATVDSYWKSVVAPLQQQVVDHELSTELQLISGGLRRPSIDRCIKRTAYFRILPGADPSAIAAWEKDLLDMPCYMTGMTNWSLSRSKSDRTLYLWEQEYLDLKDLLGEYMVHPHHWGHVDTWFDPEFSRHIVDSDICHAFCESSDNILAWTMGCEE